MSSEPVKWIIKLKDQKIIGPFSTEAVLNYISRGTLTGDEVVSEYPGGKWIPISKKVEFYDQLLETMEKKNITPTPFSSYENETVIRHFPVPLETPKAENKAENQPFPILKKPEDLKTDHAKNAIIEQKEILPKRGLVEVSNESKSENEVIDLVSDKVILQKSEKNQKAVAIGIGVFALMLVLYGIFGLDDGHDLSSKIRLVSPQKNGARYTKEESKPVLQKALTLIASDSPASYLEAQNLLVSLVESNPNDLSSRELLCLVYKELWPFSFQDNSDIQVVSQMSISVTAMNPTARASKSCEFVKYLVLGKFQEAKSRAETMLTIEEEGANNTWIPYWYKIDVLLAEKNFVNADGYAATFVKNWPYLVRGHIQYSEILEENNDSNGALEQLNIALKMNPNNKAAKIRAGILYFEKFKQTEKGLNYLVSAFESEDRADRFLESKGQFALAGIYMQRGDRDQAIESAEKAFKLNPSDGEIKKLISQLGGSTALESGSSTHLEMLFTGDHYMRLGDCMSAQAEYKAVFDADKTNAIAATRAAKCLWQLNQGLESIEYLKKAIKADPKYLQAYVLLSDYYSQRYFFDEAIKIMVKAKTVDPKSFEVIKGFAQLEQRRNNNLAAVNFGKMAEKAFSGDADLYVILAKAYLALANATNGYSKEAYKAAMRAIELDGSNSEGQVVYAEALYQEQGTEAAIIYLEDLVNKSPYVIDYRLALGDRLREEDRFKEAHAYYLQVMSLSPQNKKGQIGLAESLQGMGQMDAALSAFLLAATMDPTDPEALMKAGLLYLETGRFGPAIQQFQRVLRINGNYPRAHYFIGRSQMLQGNFEEALKSIEAEKKKNPLVADSYILSAEVYTQLKSYTKCSEEYQKAVKLRPQKADIYIKMSKCFRLSGGLDVAESMLNIAQSKESGNPDLYKERALIYQQQSLNREAVVAFNKYLALSPNATDRAEVEKIIERLGGTVD